MTAIVWDGKQLAADSLCVSGGVRMKAAKLFKLPTGHIVGVYGHFDRSADMLGWFKDNAQHGLDFDKYTKMVDKPKGEDAGIVVYFPVTGEVYEFDDTKWGFPILDDYMAWGSGREVALGAMYAGANAVTAVRAAARHMTSCDDGVVSFTAPRLVSALADLPSLDPAYALEPHPVGILPLSSVLSPTRKELLR